MGGCCICTPIPSCSMPMVRCRTPWADVQSSIIYSIHQNNWRCRKCRLVRRFSKTCRFVFCLRILFVWCMNSGVSITLVQGPPPECVLGCLHTAGDARSEQILGVISRGVGSTCSSLYICEAACDGDFLRTSCTCIRKTSPSTVAVISRKGMQVFCVCIYFS